jgi:hypothetical protein
MYGPPRLLAELQDLGYSAEIVPCGDIHFVAIRNYRIEVGRFVDRTIDLALPATPDFPRTVGSSVHIRAEPQLLECQSIPNVMNIIPSPLGEAWRYWSHNFNWAGECHRSAARLLYKINAIFDRV